MSFLARRTRTNDPPDEARSISIGDPATAELFGFGLPNYAGVSISEHAILGVPAIWRSVSLIAESIAALPMRTIVTATDGTTARSQSFLDDPAGLGGLTAHEWKQVVCGHMLIHGNSFLRHITGGFGQVVGLQPIHPTAVGVNVADDGTITYRVSLANGRTRDFDQRTMTHISSFSTDGIKGLSPISIARNHWATTLAAEKSAAQLFSHGALMSGLVTPEDDLSDEDAKTIRESLQRNALGHENAGGVAVINRKLKFSSWSISNVDLQWLESRAHQTEDVARWFGIPPHLLAQTDKQTSFGSGLTEQNRSLARHTLVALTDRIEQRLTRLLGPNLKCEFDYTALVAPDPETEITLLIAQVQAGLLTKNEARSLRNLPPLPGGDQLTPEPIKPVTAVA